MFREEPLEGCYEEPSRRDHGDTEGERLSIPVLEDPTLLVGMDDTLSEGKHNNKGKRQKAVYRLVTAPQGGTQKYTLAFAYDSPR